MSKVVFFSIPAHSHINPTIEVVRGLNSRGHRVWYHSFEEFREKLRELGAKFILKNDKPKNIKEAVFEVINNSKYKENAKELSKSFKNSGGVSKVVDAILHLIH